MAERIRTTRFADVFGSVVRGRTYGNSLYVLAALPLGLTYLLLLSAALVLDLVLLCLRVLASISIR